jgi:hypothetical protein
VELINQILSYQSTAVFLLIVGTYLGFRVGMKFGISLTLHRVRAEIDQVNEEGRRAHLELVMGRGESDREAD